MTRIIRGHTIIHETADNGDLLFYDTNGEIAIGGKMNEKEGWGLISDWIRDIERKK